MTPREQVMILVDAMVAISKITTGPCDAMRALLEAQRIADQALVDAEMKPGKVLPFRRSDD